MLALVSSISMLLLSIQKIAIIRISLLVGSSLRVRYYWPAEEELYFVTAFVPSETACFANSPGRRSRTAV